MKHTAMTVYLPPGMEDQLPVLQTFMQTMVNKLHLNRYKGFGEGLSVKSAFEGTSREFLEMRQALECESQFDAYLECADVANFALLAGMVVLRLDRPEYVDQQEELRAHMTRLEEDPGHAG